MILKSSVSKRGKENFVKSPRRLHSQKNANCQEHRDQDEFRHSEFNKVRCSRFPYTGLRQQRYGEGREVEAISAMKNSGKVQI